MVAETGTAATAALMKTYGNHNSKTKKKPLLLSAIILLLKKNQFL
jgi:hypothetical protein